MFELNHEGYRPYLGAAVMNTISNGAAPITDDCFGIG